MSIKTKTVAYGIVAIAVAVIVVGAAILAIPTPIQQTSITTGFKTQTGTQTGSSTVPMVVQLTDPPSVPNGTKSLNMSYNGISLHVSGGTGPDYWIDSNASGVVDLLSLVNVSRTLTVFQIPIESSVDMIKFNISSVVINVNGTSYLVSTSNSILTVPLMGGERLQNLSATLLELNPTVHEIIANNTSISFYLVPSATAIVKNGGVNQNDTQVGSEHRLNQTEIQDLSNARGNVSIGAISLSASGNVTDLNLTLTNDGNVSVALSAIILQGSFNSTGIFSSASSCSTSIETTTSTNEIDQITTANSTSTGENGDHETHFSNSTSSSGTRNDTSTTTYTTTTMPAPGYDSHTSNSGDSCGVENSVISELPHEVVLAANGNQLIVLSAEDSGDGQVNKTQLVLAPGQSETFSLKGVISYSFGDQNNHTLNLTPIVGSTYAVQADLSNDVHVTVDVNATS
jgi:hypothetical protein